MNSEGPMTESTKRPLGGVIHTYQKYDPQKIPSPTQPPPDLVSPAFEHMLAWGDMRELTDEELANAIHLDPSQIAGLGPSLDALRQMLEERKQRILETYETRAALKQAASRYQNDGKAMKPPKPIRQMFDRAFKEEQLRELEQLWYRAGGERSPFAASLMQLIARLGDKYQVDELDAKYKFTGREEMTVEKALDVKEELEQIDKLLKQLEEAAKTAQLAIIDMESLAQFAEPGDMEQLNELQQQIENFVREQAERQGLEKTRRGYQLTPKAYRLFQGKLLERIFDALAPSRTGRHQTPVIGEGAVELQQTKLYEFGDSLANIDLPASFTNAMLRSEERGGFKLRSEDIEVHRTRNHPKCATCVLMDMSGSMRYDGLYIHVKKMGLALEGLIRREYPGDFLQFIEMYTFAKPRHASEIATLMPKMPTIHNPVVRLRADMSKEEMTESRVPAHFTNIQHSISLARRFLSAQDTPNRQIILITDGLPTAHFEGEHLFMLYPPDPRTEEATMREALLCRREGITINIFLLPTWSQSREDVKFAYRLAESSKGRVFFTAGKDLDRYVVWDYVSHRRHILS